VGKVWKGRSVTGEELEKCRSMRKPCREGGSSSRCAEPRGGGLAGNRARPLSECREHAASLHAESGLAPLCHHTWLVRAASSALAATSKTKTAQSHDLSAARFECCLDKSKNNRIHKARPADENNSRAHRAVLSSSRLTAVACFRHIRAMASSWPREHLHHR
jgi:hypothetical protein